MIVTDYRFPDLCFLRFRTDAGTRQSLTGTVQSPTGAMKSPAMFWLCRAQCAGRKEHGVRSLERGAMGLALPAWRLNPNSEARPPRALLAAPAFSRRRSAGFSPLHLSKKTDRTDCSKKSFANTDASGVNAALHCRR